MKKILDLYKKYEEIINYLIFGVLTTIISISTYALFTNILLLDIFISNIISWILSVLFAFITNKLFVFKSKNEFFSKNFIECIKFYSSRLFSLGAESLILFIGVSLMKIDDMFIKIVAQFVVIVLNYILSKLLVFKNSKK